MIGAEDVLQEQHLKLDGVLDGVAVVFHPHRAGRGLRQFIHQRQIGDSFAERRHERFARQAETVRLAVVRRSQHHEGAFTERRRKRAHKRRDRIPSRRTG